MKIYLRDVRAEMLLKGAVTLSLLYQIGIQPSLDFPLEHTQGRWLQKLLPCLLKHVYPSKNARDLG